MTRTCISAVCGLVSSVYFARRMYICCGECFQDTTGVRQIGKCSFAKVESRSGVGAASSQGLRLDSVAVFEISTTSERNKNDDDTKNLAANDEAKQTRKVRCSLIVSAGRREVSPKMANMAQQTGISNHTYVAGRERGGGLVLIAGILTLLSSCAFIVLYY